MAACANTFCQLKLVTKRPCSGWKKAFVCRVDGRWLNPEFSTNVHPNVQLVIDANLFLGWRHVTLQWFSQKILFSLYRLLLNGSRSLGRGFGFSKARFVQTNRDNIGTLSRVRIILHDFMTICFKFQPQPIGPSHDSRRPVWPHLDLYQRPRPAPCALGRDDTAPSPHGGAVYRVKVLVDPVPRYQ